MDSRIKILAWKLKCVQTVCYILSEEYIKTIITSTVKSDMLGWSPTLGAGGNDLPTRWDKQSLAGACSREVVEAEELQARGATAKFLRPTNCFRIVVSKYLPSAATISRRTRRRKKKEMKDWPWIPTRICPVAEKPGLGRH